MKERFYCESCVVVWRDTSSVFNLYQFPCPQCGELCDASLDQAQEYQDCFQDEPGNLTDSRDLSAIESDEDADAESDGDTEGGSDGDTDGGGEK